MVADRCQLELSSAYKVDEKIDLSDAFYKQVVSLLHSWLFLAHTMIGWQDFPFPILFAGSIYNAIAHLVLV